MLLPIVPTPYPILLRHVNLFSIRILLLQITNRIFYSLFYQKIYEKDISFKIKFSFICVLLPAFTVSFRINLIVLLDFPRQNVEQGGVAGLFARVAAFFFKIGKATLDKKEQTNLEFYVRNAMKADKDKTFTLIGSADKDTGTKEINQRLSEQRMEYVYNLLKDKYGIDPSRLVKKAEGDTNNRFAEPELNRVVIVE